MITFATEVANAPTPAEIFYVIASAVLLGLTALLFAD